jgi:subtilisin family serine protease
VRRLVGFAAIVAAATVLPGAAARSHDASSDALIHADAARAAGFTGNGVTVAIVDTGVDGHNPDLSDSIAAEHCFVPPDGCPNGTAEQDGPGSAQDDQGHGTAVAGLITGNGGTAPTGVAPDARLVVVKVTDRNGRTSSAQIIAGLNWILANHPEVRAVNVSLAGDILLSGTCDNVSQNLKPYATVIDTLRARGTIVFAPTGNSGSRFSIPAPACLHSTVAVGAVYSRSFGSYTVPLVCRDATTAANQVACFSNSSAELDLLAPGAPIESTALGGGLSNFAGTSAASAEAVGAAAVLLQADPSLTPDEIEAALQDTGVPVEDPRTRAITPRLDVAAALSSVLGRPIPLLPTPPSTGPPAPPTLSSPTVPVATLALKPIAFGSIRLGSSTRRTLVVCNTGTGFLTVRIGAVTAPFTAGPAKLLIPAGGRARVMLTFRPTRAATYSRPLKLATDDPTAAAITIPLRGTGKRPS